MQQLLFLQVQFGELTFPLHIPIHIFVIRNRITSFSLVKSCDYDKYFENIWQKQRKQR